MGQRILGADGTDEGMNEMDGMALVAWLPRLAGCCHCERTNVSVAISHAVWKMTSVVALPRHDTLPVFASERM